MSIKLTVISKTNNQVTSSNQCSVIGNIFDDYYKDLININKDLNYSIKDNANVYLDDYYKYHLTYDYEVNEINKKFDDYEMGYHMFKEDNTKRNVKDSLWFKTLSYSKNALFFKNNSYEIFYFNFQAKCWIKLDYHKDEYYFGSGVRSVELPDLSYFITGGSDINSQPVDKCGHFYHNNIKVIDKMRRPRKSHSIIYLRGYVYVFGGISEYDTPTDECERYCLVLGNYNKWKPIARMNYPRAYATPVAYGKNFVFIIGGYCNIMGNTVNIV